MLLIYSDAFPVAADAILRIITHEADYNLTLLCILRQIPELISLAE